MSEEEIRLDQTIKVFDMLALLIKNNETCSYRYLIYDMLGFKEENYAELISGMSITNKLVECETQKKAIDKIKEYIKENTRYYDKELGLVEMMGAKNIRTPVIYLYGLLELLEEIE